ncbi:MAG: ATP-dependent DNA helicase, partial [Ktedonobacterales bacterium]
VFGEQHPEERVYYVERLGGAGRRAGQLSVSAAPLDVTELLREKLFDKISTVATSATLAVNNDFRFFRKRVGLTEAVEKVLPLSFNFQENALLYVPRMRREPAFGAASGPYFDELADEMRQLVEASRGRAFLLFSSQAALRGVYERLKQTLIDEDFWPIFQGPHISRIEMLRQFRERDLEVERAALNGEPTPGGAVLFGLKSFWEGVDVAGEALSLVAVDKLPFDPPDDPVNEARITKMKELGENWFGDYVLPLAILRLKQGIGRLLRTKDDRGVMAILDTRLHTKGYGRQVLAALPPARRVSDIARVRAFFAED